MIENIPVVYEGNDNYIFISYSHLDKGIVFEFALKLQEKGYNIWLDTGLQYSKEWDEQIAKRINDCSLFIFMITRHSLDSAYCTNELHFAEVKKKSFLNVLVDNIPTLPDTFILRYGRFQMCELNNYPTLDQAIASLERNSEDFKKLKNIKADVEPKKKENPSAPKKKTKTKKEAPREVQTIVEQSDKEEKDNKEQLPPIPKETIKQFRNFSRLFIRNNIDDFVLSVSKKTLSKYKGKDEIVVVPEKTTTIESLAFDTKQLKVVIISKNVKRIDPRAFIHAHNLENIIVDPENPYFASFEDVLFSRDFKRLISYPQKKMDSIYQIPSFVQAVNQYAFYMCSNLNELVMNSSGIVIKSKGIHDCDSLKTITFNNKILMLEKYAISRCSKLERIVYFDTRSSWNCVSKYQFFADDRNIITLILGKNKKTIEVRCKDGIVCEQPVVYKENI